MAVLAVDVTAVRERHCAAAVSQQWRRLWSLERGLKPAMHILNKVFDSNTALLASFVTAVVYSSSYEPAGLSFCHFCPFGYG